MENNDFLSAELDKVEEHLLKTLKTKSKMVEASLRDFVKSGGKRLRPSLTIIGSSFGDYKSEVVIPLASSIEILHMATLIHDDIIDDAETRRGTRTMQATLGKNTAVYCGDFLFTKAFMLIADMAEVDMMKDLSNAIAFICNGEIDQNEQRYNQTVDDILDFTGNEKTVGKPLLSDAKKFINKALKLNNTLPDGYGKDAITAMIEKQLERKF